MERTVEVCGRQVWVCRGPTIEQVKMYQPKFHSRGRLIRVLNGRTVQFISKVNLEVGLSFDVPKQ